jgi:hypothetical protein
MLSSNEKANCKQKTRYKSNIEARQSIERLKHKRGVNKSLRVYKCPVCFQYHITSSPSR